MFSAQGFLKRFALLGNPSERALQAHVHTAEAQKRAPACVLLNDDNLAWLDNEKQIRRNSLMAYKSPKPHDE